MGKVLAPVGAMFGIGQQDDPTFNPAQDRQAKYDKFVDAAHPEIEGVAGTKMATDAIQSNPLMSGLYGEGGLQSQLGAEGKDLAGRGYSLQQPDYEAYGQASGDIARQFGQQEADTANSLNRRGLGGASSGAAGAAFSGLAGNKNEMLAKAQTDIAQKRMQDTQQRLQANRAMQSQLGQQANTAIGDQYGRQLQGYNAQGNALNQSVQNQQNANQQARQANEDAIGHKSKNIGDAWAEGTYSGTKSGTADATSSWMKMGGSGAMGMSDERNKTNVSDGGPQARGFLQQVANSHDYSAAPSSGGEEKKSGGGPMDMMSGLMGGGGESAGGASGGGMGSMMSMFSDENSKENVHGGGNKIRGFLDSVEPHSYEYKDEYKHGLGGPGEYVSPMAQELEQTDLGKDMVQDTPDGKVVDYGKGFGTLLAGMADVNKRLSAIEGRK